MKSYCQFGIRGLMIIVVGAGVGMAWVSTVWDFRRLERELRQERDRSRAIGRELTHLKELSETMSAELEFHSHRNSAIKLMRPDRPDHKDAIRILTSMRKPAAAVQCVGGKGTLGFDAFLTVFHSPIEFPVATVEDIDSEIITDGLTLRQEVYFATELKVVAVLFPVFHIRERDPFYSDVLVVTRRIGTPGDDYKVEVKDWDGDGVADVIITTPDGVTVHRSTKTGFVDILPITTAKGIIKD